MRNITHVLFFSKDFNHPKIESAGGTGAFYYELAQKLTKMGIKVSVFGIGKRNQLIKEGLLEVRMVKDFFKSHPFHDLCRSLTKDKSFLEKWHFRIYKNEKKWLAKQLRKFIATLASPPDIIETHDFNGLALSLQNINIPYVVRCHGSWTILEKYFGYENVSSATKYCEKTAFKKTDHVISISEYSKKINTQTFEIKDPALIYNGIDADFYSRDASVDKIENSIFVVGKISRHKGSHKALDAFINVKSKLKEATLHYIGSGGDFEEKLKARALESGVAGSVFFHGHKNKFEVKRLLSAAEIAYFLSEGENFSLAVLETLSMGIPVISSDIPPLKEVITSENGFICNNIHEIEEATLNLLMDKNNLPNYSANARATIIKNYTLDKMCTETLDYYDKIINK